MKNAQLLQRKMRLRPFSAAERLVRWVEFAAEFPDGLAELNLPGEELGWLAYYSIDVMLVSLLVLAVSFWVVMVIIGKSVKMVVCLVVRKKEKIQ